MAELTQQAHVASRVDRDDCGAPGMVNDFEIRGTRIGQLHAFDIDLNDASGEHGFDRENGHGCWGRRRMIVTITLRLPAVASRRRPTIFRPRHRRWPGRTSADRGATMTCRSRESATE